jgi:pimeloyl-ACP methyl ester carboxylesterase
MSRRQWLAGTGAAVAAGAAVGVGTIVGALARDVLRAELAVDDGPDDLLVAPSTEPERRMVTTVDGTRLHVEIHGPRGEDTGDVVVAVHGWTCNTAFWNAQINHLAGTHTVVVYDQRGHGRSELGRARPTIDMLGRDLDAVLAAVVPPGRRAMLVGHSMGGMTIMSWAAQFPEKVPTIATSAVLASTAAHNVVNSTLLLPTGLPRYTRPFVPAINRAFTSAPVPLPHTAYSGRFAHYVALGSAARASHVEFVDTMIAACPPRARAGWGSAMGRLDVRAGLAALTVPTTVIVGDEDRLTPPAHAEQIAEILRGHGHLREHVVLPGVGHMSPIEAAGRVDEIQERQAAQTLSVPVGQR